MKSRSRMVRLVAAGLVAFVMLMAACARPGAGQPTKAVLSLDWVPNTNHTGFFVAFDKGWYAEEGIALEIQTPSDPSAALKQVAAGNTEFGVSFQEEVTVARSQGVPVVSIGAIIQHNTSAFASLKSAGIHSAADWVGKTYASYGLPIEKPIMRGLMDCAGASIDQVEFVDVGFDAFPALLAGRADIAWIFMGWDGVQAELKGVELQTVPLYGDCVPDYYTPVVVVGEKTLAEKGDLVKRFMQATARGYAFAAANPDQAAEILLKHSPESDPALVVASQRWLSPRYQDDAPRWGEQDPGVWSRFAAWMNDNGLLEQPVDASRAFTNAYLPE